MSSLPSAQYSTLIKRRFRNLARTDPIQGSQLSVYAPLVITMEEAPSLSHLAPELLLEIFEHLTPIRGLRIADYERQEENLDRVEALHSLTLTCRHVHAVAQQILYQAYIHVDDLHEQRLFTDTILKNRSLAKHLRYVELYSFSDKESIVLSPLQADEVATAILQTKWHPHFQDPTDIDAWLEGEIGRLIDKGNHSELQSALILALAENLEDCAILWTMSPLLFGILALKHYNSDSGLRNLWLANEEEEGEFDALMDTFSLVQNNQIPVSHQLWIEDTDELDEDVPGDGPTAYPNFDWLPTQAAPLASLVLKSCSIENDRPNELLRHRSGLKTFSIEWSPKWSPERGPDDGSIDVSKLNASLSSHAKTLETLTIDTIRSEIDVRIVPFGSFKHFTALKRLNIFGPAIRGGTLLRYDATRPLRQGREEFYVSKVLPPSLEHLTVLEERGEPRYCLSVDQGFKARLPNLKTIHYPWPYTPRGYEPKLIADVALLGIELNWLCKSDEEEASRIVKPLPLLRSNIARMTASGMGSPW